VETIVQFLARGDTFMARGQLHTIKHPCRDGARRKVLVIGERADGRYFEAEFDWGDTVDTYDGIVANGGLLAELR
jgi:hypothetical protein